MPQKVSMNLHTNNTNQFAAQQYMEAMTRLQKSAPPKLSSLKTPMIGRIHNIRPGCGSCGRG